MAKITPQEAKAELAKRELATRELRYFIRYTFPEYIFGEWHKELFDVLQRVEQGDIKRLIVQMPPRAGKTEIISKRFPAWCMGRNPKLKVIGTSYGSELSSRNSREARQIIQSQRFKNAFPKCKISDEKKEASNWETSEGGGYYSVGVGGALTGMGFNIGIVDDYTKNREDAESPTIREKTWDWYTSTFYTRKQDENAAIIVLATRWHDDDLIGRLLKQETGDHWHIIKFPALNEQDESFFPERFSSVYYQNERENIGMRDFAALYQQDPIVAMGALFKKEDFRYFAMSDLDANKNDFEVGIVCDPAFSTRNGSDDMVTIALARHRKSGEFYEIDRFADTTPPSVSKTIPVNMALKYKSAGWNVTFLSVEDVSINKDQAMFVNSVDEEMRKSNLHIPLRRYKPKTKKEDRIKFKVEPVIARHAYYFRCDDTANRAWAKGEEQFLRFPTANHDDIPDTIAQGIEQFEDRAYGDSGSRAIHNSQLRDLQRLQRGII